MMLDNSDADTDPAWNMDGIAISDRLKSGSIGTPSKSTPRSAHRRRRSRQLARSNTEDSEERSAAGALSFPFSFDDLDAHASRSARDIDADDEDETGGLLWSNNYFFYNRKLRRIVFVTCWGRKVGNAPFAPAQVHNFGMVESSTAAEGLRRPSQILPMNHLRSFMRPPAAGMASSAPSAFPHTALQPLFKRSPGLFNSNQAARMNKLATQPRSNVPQNPRKHYTTPPASAPGTSSVNASSHPVSPTASTHSSSAGGSLAGHGSTHRRQKRRTNSQGSIHLLGREDRRRRTGVVTPARKIV